MTGTTASYAGGASIELTTGSDSGKTHRVAVSLLRIAAIAVAATAVAFLVNDYLTFWHDWPGFLDFAADRAWFGFEALSPALDDAARRLGWIQALVYAGTVLGVTGYVLATPAVRLREDAERLSAIAAFIVRAAFWSVLLVGLADMLISFLRVEGLLANVVGEELNTQLGRSVFRGQVVHLPLIGLGCVVALFNRSLGFPWLALLVVVAELQIVILRFIFSYEQAFMGDLVRFWYAALFLFASAYTLIHEGHVRVDVFYTNFSTRGKAWANIGGSLLLGLPLCWTILTQGLWAKGSSINAPLLSYEISQSGYGMYVKYLMAGFLIVFALSMIVQFCSYILSNAAELLGEPDHQDIADNTVRA